MVAVHHIYRPGTPFPYANASLCYMQGSGAVLADDDDGTYIRSDTTILGDPIGMWAALLPAIPSSVLDDPTLGVLVVRNRASVAGEDAGDRIYRVYGGTFADGPDVDFSDSDIIPQGSIHDFVGISVVWDATNPALRDGTACVFFTADPPGADESTSSATLYEYSLILTTDEVLDIPERRIYPRPSTRIFPPPATVQAGRRIGSSSIL